MDYNLVATLHKNDLAILALRKNWLPLAISFLHHMFKRKHEVQLSRDSFREQLDVYLENINMMLPDDGQYRHEADYYVERWSREDDLIRVRSRDDGYVILLSPHAERLIGWFEDMQDRGMIGTESHLRTILSLLDEVVTRSTEDIEARLRQLYDRHNEIEAEIARIHETQEVDGFTDVQIRERLDHISSIASQLLRDFSRVEERFREMARSIQQAQLNPDMRRGEILRTALNADEQLEISDEGQSFRAFYELLAQHIKPQHVIIVENLINFLTLPKMPNSVGLFGGGFAVHLLRDVTWLANCNLIYWGDMDAHGFEILSDLRGMFHHTVSVMMDQETFDLYWDYVGRGVSSRSERFGHLTDEEAQIAQVVVEHGFRLEQEHIPQSYAVTRLKQLLISF